MTMQRDSVNELFGLAGTLPRPGWVLLDAARDHRFTGELVFETSPRVRVYFDRGHIYLAERLTDPSLGARLVDAGALTAVQRERGSVRIGEIEHLGRLFERTPTLDRHTVMVTAELMTDECVGWLAAQRVPDVAWKPYRHHESGMHLWNRAPGSVDLVPGDALPAPAAGAAPISMALPHEAGYDRELHAEPFLDGLIQWDEPAWLDSSQFETDLIEPTIEPAGADSSGVETSHPATPVRDDEPASDDWVDRLVDGELPEADPLSRPKPLPRLPVEPVERFELVWPSGEIDEEFGAVESVVGDGHDPDADRVGATARLGRPIQEPPALDAWEPGPAPSPATDPSDGHGEPTDQIVLAVRRAVASIEIGSLAARQRLVDNNVGLGGVGAAVADGFADPVGVPEPGRVAVRSGRNDWSRRTVARSVFDEPVVEPEAVEPETVPEVEDHRERRASALRRLISSLRR